MQLTHKFSQSTRPRGSKGKGKLGKDEKVHLNFELTFSSEDAIVKLAVGWIQTVFVHKWFQESKGETWGPGQLIKIDENGDRALTTEERVALMSETERQALLEALMKANQAQ